jgi:chromosome segregation ATPase
MAQMQKQIYDLTDLFNKSQNIKKEFDFINQQISYLKDSQIQMSHKMEDYNREAINLNEKNAAQIRNHTQEFKDVKKFMEKKREEKIMLQEVLDSYKDRMVEKFKTMTDEFNAELKSIDKRYSGLNDAVAQLKRRVETNSNSISED